MNGNRVHLPHFSLEPRNPRGPGAVGVRSSALSLPGPGGSGRGGPGLGDPSSRFKGSKAQRRGSPSRKPGTSGNYCIPSEGLGLPQLPPSGQRTVKSRERRSSARGPPLVRLEATVEAAFPSLFQNTTQLLNLSNEEHRSLLL